MVAIGMGSEAASTIGQAAWRDARRAKAYAAALRHSARVRFLRRAIPIGTGLSILAVMIVGIFDPFRSIGAVSVGPISLSGSKITMENPRLTGFRAKDAQPYEVTADAASQDIRKPNQVELHGLRARINMENNGFVRLEATSGLYDTQKEQMELRQSVRILTDSGHDARLSSAFVDFKGGTVTSREPVTVTFKGGSIESQRLDVTDNGKKLTFEGRVRAIFETDQVAQPGAPKGRS